METTVEPPVEFCPAFTKKGEPCKLCKDLGRFCFSPVKSKEQLSWQWRRWWWLIKVVKMYFSDPISFFVILFHHHVSAQQFSKTVRPMHYNTGCHCHDYGKNKSYQSSRIITIPCCPFLYPMHFLHIHIWYYSHSSNKAEQVGQTGRWILALPGPSTREEQAG